MADAAHLSPQEVDLLLDLFVRAKDTIVHRRHFALGVLDGTGARPAVTLAQSAQGLLGSAARMAIDGEDAAALELLHQVAADVAASAVELHRQLLRGADSP